MALSIELHRTASTAPASVELARTVRTVPGIGTIAIVLAVSVQALTDGGPTVEFFDVRTGNTVGMGAELLFPGGVGYRLEAVRIYLEPAGVRATVTLSPFEVGPGDVRTFAPERTIAAAARQLAVGSAGDGSNGTYLVTVADPLGAPTVPP